MASFHEIVTHEINCHQMSSHEINYHQMSSHEINLPLDQLSQDQFATRSTQFFDVEKFTPVEIFLILFVATAFSTTITTEFTETQRRCKYYMIH